MLINTRKTGPDRVRLTKTETSLLERTKELLDGLTQANAGELSSNANETNSWLKCVMDDLQRAEGKTTATAGDAMDKSAEAPADPPAVDSGVASDEPRRQRR